MPPATVRSEWSHAKTEPVARNGMVTAAHHLAADAGVEVLREGGNAVDAAFAAGFVMGGVEPFTSIIGGIAALVIRRADGSVVAIERTSLHGHGLRAAMVSVLRQPCGKQWSCLTRARIAKTIVVSSP